MPIQILESSGKTPVRYKELLEDEVVLWIDITSANLKQHVLRWSINILDIKTESKIDRGNDTLHASRSQYYGDICRDFDRCKYYQASRE